MPSNPRFRYDPLRQVWYADLPSYETGEVRPSLTVEGARHYGVTFRADFDFERRVEPTPNNNTGKPALASLVATLMRQHSNPHLKWEKFGAGFAEAVWNTVPTFNPYTDVITVNSPDRYEWQEFSYTHRYTRGDEAWTVTLTIALTHLLDNDTLVLRNPRIT